MQKILLLFLILAAGCNAAYFKITDKIPLCFAEEVGYGSERVVIEWWRRKSTSFNMNTDITVTVVSPQTRTTAYQNSLRDNAGSFTFKPIANEMGEYDICFSSKNADLEEHESIDLGISIDHNDRRMHLPEPDQGFTRMHPAPGANGDEIFIFQDYDGQIKEALKTHDYIERLTKNLFQIEKEMAEVKNEIKYFHERQIRMRQTSESTFERVWGWSVATIVTVVVCAWMQFTFLKSFLRQKKVI